MIGGGDSGKDEKGRRNERKADDRGRTRVGEVGRIRNNLTEGVGISNGLSSWNSRDMMKQMYSEH